VRMTSTFTIHVFCEVMVTLASFCLCDCDCRFFEDYKKVRMPAEVLFIFAIFHDVLIV
jgi:hypothetical protein